MKPQTTDFEKMFPSLKGRDGYVERDTVYVIPHPDRGINQHVVLASDVETFCIDKSLNSARMKFINETLDELEKYRCPKKIYDAYLQSREDDYWDFISLENKVLLKWLVESVMSGVFDEIILKEGEGK